MFASALPESLPRNTRFRSPTVLDQELAADPDVDAVVITTQDDLHAPMAADFARAGKHILLEKPLATNVEDATAAVEAAERAGVVLMLSLHEAI